MMFGQRKKLSEETGKVGTIIGKEIEIVGNLRGGGAAIRIEGLIEGIIANEGNIHISKTGKILGELKGESIKVCQRNRDQIKKRI